MAVTLLSKPPVQPPIRRTFLRRKLYQTTITWGDKDSFAEYMHDSYGGDKDFTLMPVVPLDKVKHPWDTDLMMDLCKIRINCISRLARQGLRGAMDTNDYSRNGCISRTVYQGPDVLSARYR